MGILENEGEATRDLLGRLDNHLPYLLIEAEKNWLNQPLRHTIKVGTNGLPERSEELWAVYSAFHENL